jgi:hypothetical protein
MPAVLDKHAAGAKSESASAVGPTGIDVHACKRMAAS